MVAERSNLFVFDGPHGHGKTTALRIASRYGAEYDVAILRKATTRSVREEEVGRECLDTVFVSRDEFALRCQDRAFWTYRNGDEYGFHVGELQSLCSSHRNVCCILTDSSIIRRLQLECPAINVVPVFIYAGDGSIVAERLATVGTAAENHARTARSGRIFDAYRTDPFLFRHHILNLYDYATLEQHVLNLFALYAEHNEYRRQA